MSTFTYSTNANDCWGAVGSITLGSTTLYMGGNPGTDDNTTDWIPFVVPDIPKGTVIVSATLRLIAFENSSDAVNVRMGCEAADNPSTPVSGTDIVGRVLTTAFTDFSLVAYTAGVEYTYDVTAAVQEILNRAGWAPGNTLAVLIKDNDASDSLRHRVAAFEDTTYTEPRLDIVVESFIPQGVML